MADTAPTYRAVEVAASGELQLTRRPLLDPVAGEVRIKVDACGVCHTDVATIHPHPETEPNVVPGHEVVGVIDALGEGVEGWEIGRRVGVGLLGGNCGHCYACRERDFLHCENQQRTGLHRDGGYAEYMTAKTSGLVAIPAEYDSAAAAPLLCAGLTTYNALIHAGVAPRDLVAVQAIGGLGHLAVQYADKMGMNTVALARGSEKEPLALELGADRYIDVSDAAAAVTALKALGGADVIVTTASSGAASSALVDGLAMNGKLMVVGASQDPVTIATGDVIDRGIQVLGSLTGSPAENEENLAFASRQGVAAWIEVMPLAEAAAAYARMLEGKARFRMVLVP
ncbi:MAG TPA: alcohol dehydrogenase catalytic domain-containing protein [Solirubrobacterales bacterium]